LKRWYQTLYIRIKITGVIYYKKNAHKCRLKGDTLNKHVRKIIVISSGYADIIPARGINQRGCQQNGHNRHPIKLIGEVPRPISNPKHSQPKQPDPDIPDQEVHPPLSPSAHMHGIKDPHEQSFIRRWLLLFVVLEGVVCVGVLQVEIGGALVTGGGFAHLLLGAGGA